MKELYMLLCDGAEWEDITLFDNKEEAIQSSIKYPKRRVEIFIKTSEGYIPTYSYYKNGEYIVTSQ